VAVPFLLNNKIKFAITLTVADESEDKGGWVWQVWWITGCAVESLAVDLQYKKHILVFHSFSFNTRYICYIFTILQLITYRDLDASRYVAVGDAGSAATSGWSVSWSCGVQCSTGSGSSRLQAHTFTH
jgi:hypothetical protein